MKKWMVQVDPPKEDCTVKKMNGRSLLLCSNKIIHDFKEWTTPSLMGQTDPFNSSCSQKLQLPEIKLRLQLLPKSNSLEKVVVPKVSLASANF